MTRVRIEPTTTCDVPSMANALPTSGLIVSIPRLLKLCSEMSTPCFLKERSLYKILIHSITKSAKTIKVIGFSISIGNIPDCMRKRKAPITIIISNEIGLKRKSINVNYTILMLYLKRN